MTAIMIILMALNLFFAYGNLVKKKNYAIGIFNLVSAVICVVSLLPH